LAFIIAGSMHDVISTLSDAQRLASVGRVVNATLELASCERLRGLVVAPFGQVQYRLEFGTDIVQHPTVVLSLKGSARLMCQRSMEAFDFPLNTQIKLAFIADETEESGLMPEFDPILVGTGEKSFIEIVEDELILLIPNVPVNPEAVGAEVKPAVWEAKSPERQSPFASLAQLLNPPKKN
jgi:uncharacterized protein